MLRLVELALFLAPFLFFAVWRFMALEGGPPVRLVVGAACVLALLAGALIWLSHGDALPPGAAYATGPATGWQDRLGPRRTAMSEPPVQRIEPPAFLAEPMLAAVLAALPEARVVGGAVRDALAGRTVAEVDLATPRTPEQVQKSLQAAGIRIVPTGLDHGTVTAVANGRSFEVTTLRRDVETDGRHAVVVFTDDWRADAARRDFTINAMSLDRTGDLYDYFGGLGDLRAGILRFVGDPATRIAEDYLRILRYFRFYTRLCRRSSRSRRAGSDPCRCGRNRQAVGRARMERVGPYHVSARSACRYRLDGGVGRTAGGAAGRCGHGAACAPGRGACPGGSAVAPRGAGHGRSRGDGCTPAALGVGARSTDRSACRTGAAARRRWRGAAPATCR